MEYPEIFAFPPMGVHPEIIEELDLVLEGGRGLEEVRDILKKHLKNALRLEFATVPAYLTAAFSLKESNQAIRMLLVRIAKEEMLHMLVVANVMNAIGVEPKLKKILPQYHPNGYKLDMLYNSPVLNLESFSIGTPENPGVLEKFMQIEAPLKPDKYKVKPPEELDAVGIPPKTIGEFYEQIIKILKGNPELFEKGDPGKQLSTSIIFREVQVERPPKPAGHYPLPTQIKLADGRELPFDFKVEDSLTAEAYINWLVDEGEGSPQEPMDAEGLSAHYYRLESILHSYYLVEDPDEKGRGGYDGGFSFSGANLKFDKNGVHEFDVNPSLEQYETTKLYRKIRNFARSFSNMLDQLERALNSTDQETKSDGYIKSKREMNSMVAKANSVIKKAESERVKGGLPFEYVARAN